MKIGKRGQKKMKKDRFETKSKRKWRKIDLKLKAKENQIIRKEIKVQDVLVFSSKGILETGN